MEFLVELFASFSQVGNFASVKETNGDALFSEFYSVLALMCRLVKALTPFPPFLFTFAKPRYFFLLLVSDMVALVMPVYRMQKRIIYMAFLLLYLGNCLCLGQ